MRVTFKSWLLARHDDIPAWRRLLAFLVLGVLAVLMGFVVFSARDAGLLIKHWGYYVIAGTFAWWVCSLIVLGKADGAGRLGWWRARATGELAQVAVLIAFLTAVALMTVPRVYKVLFDEVVIQSTAWNMHMEREVGGVNRAFVIDGLLRSLETYLDKRPYFFPFLVSLLHDFTGYREANAFWLNTALMPAVLGLVYWLGRRLGGHGPAMAAVAGLGAFSLLAMNANGSGLEMLNLTMIAAMIVIGVLYLEKPDDTRATVLVLTTVLLANTRYESSIYAGCAALILLEGWRRAGRIVLPAAGIFAPLLLVPYALHNTYLSGTPMLWELRDGAAARFSTEYLVKNLGYAQEFFFNVRGTIANSIWLAVAGPLAAGGLAFWAWRRKPQWGEWSPVAATVALVSLGIVGNLALLMAYYWGDLSDPVVSRLSLPLYTLLALVLAGALGRMQAPWREKASGAAVILALLVYLLFGVQVNQMLDTQNTMEVAQRWEVDVLKRRGPAERLIVTDKSPLSWFVRDVPAIMPGRITMRPDSLPYHLKHHTFDEVLITQTLVPAGDGVFWLAPEHRVPANYILEVIAERRVAGKLHRISRLKEIRMDPERSAEVSSTP